MKIKIRSYLKYIITTVLFYLLFTGDIVCYADAKAKTLEDVELLSEADFSSKQVGKIKEGQTILILRQVTGADAYIWFQIRNGAKIGYIRSDFVKVTDFDGELYATDPTIGGIWEDDQEQTPVIPTPVATEEKPDILPGFEYHKWANIEDAFFYRNGDFFIYYGQLLNGAPSWYMVDIANQTVQRYVLAPEDNAIVPKSKEMPVPLSTEERPYIIDGFKSSQWWDREGTCYRKDDFVIYYGQIANSTPDWYLVDMEKQTVQRYVYATEDITVAAKNNYLLPLIGVVLAVLIIIPMFFIFIKTDK